MRFGTRRTPSLRAQLSHRLTSSCQPPRRADACSARARTETHSVATRPFEAAGHEHAGSLPHGARSTRRIEPPWHLHQREHALATHLAALHARRKAHCEAALHCAPVRELLLLQLLRLATSKRGREPARRHARARGHKLLQPPEALGEDLALDEREALRERRERGERPRTAAASDPSPLARIQLPSAARLRSARCTTAQARRVRAARGSPARRGATAPAMHPTASRIAATAVQRQARCHPGRRARLARLRSRRRRHWVTRVRIRMRRRGALSQQTPSFRGRQG